MPKTCRQCRQSFEITADDLRFYERISPIFQGQKYLIPEPTFCPNCRQQRRLSFRNERKLTIRPSTLSKRPIVSMYAADKPFPVYDQEEWWGDQWDARSYAQDFDFTRPFFAQFHELFQRVPRISLINREHENSAYCNFSMRNKNSYLLFTSGYAEDSFHSNRSLRLKNVCDCSNVTDSELCYEIVDADHCYNCCWLQSSRHCTNCTLGYDLKNCTDCFACSGLNQKRYHIFNVAYSAAEYAQKVAELQKDMFAVHAEFITKARQAIHKYADILHSENCSGNALAQCKNAVHCFEAKNLEDCRYIYDATSLKNCMDINNNDNSELDYEVIGGESDFHQMLSDISWFNHDITYCSLCFFSNDLFGCIGLKHAQYCILNKQYSKEEYEQLVPKIMEHMIKTGEWGEFFPTEISPFAYNETIAQEYFPLTKAAVLEKDWKWREEEEPDFSGVTKKIPAEKLPKNIADIPDDLINWAIECTESKRLYKIQKPELDFYRSMKLPIPHFHPDVRHSHRMKLRNPRRLWSRNCLNCQQLIETPYAPNRPEIVYCEQCYLQTAY